MKKHPSFLSVAIAFALVVIGYEAAVNGRAIGASIVPFITTSCSSTGPCIGGANASSGAGVLASSANGRGLYAFTKHVSTTSATGSYGVLGQDASASGAFNSGVFGTSVRGTGVSGVSTSGAGISGTSTNGVGISATSTNGIAMSATSTNYLGVYGNGSSYGTYGASNGYGAVGVGSTSGLYGSGGTYGVYAAGTTDGVRSSSGAGTAVYASSSSGRLFEGHTSSGLGVYITNGGGNASDLTGSYIALLGRSNSFPLVLTDGNGNNVFYVDGSGNVYYHGSLQTFAERAPGVRLYNPQSTSPAVEETGTAHLAAGRASVYFSANFARAIDAARGYQVFLTPNGDTRGLYVQGKYARGFIVREVEGGRGNLDFDYRIYARTNERDVGSTETQPNARPIVRAAEPPAPSLRRQPRR